MSLTVARKNSGERRQLACTDWLPASRSVHLAEIVPFVFGKLPKTAGWQPALPRL